VLRDAGLDRKDPLGPLRDAWRDAVGREIAEGTKVKGFKGGVLTIEVASAALAHELGVYHGKALAKRLREQANGSLQDIRFKVVGSL
jgi:hypothetical protein